MFSASTFLARATALGLYGTYMWATVQGNLAAAALVFLGTGICAAGGLSLAAAESSPT